MPLYTTLVEQLPKFPVTIFDHTLNLTTYLVAFGLFLLIIGLSKLIQEVVLVYLRAWSKRTSTDIDDTIIEAVASIRMIVYVVLAGYVSLNLFALPAWAGIVLTAVTLSVVMWQAIEMALYFVDYAVQRFVAKDEDGDGVVDPNAATASDLIVLISRIVLFALGILFVLSNLGIEVTALIAGLGVGGIAVAFALQGILSDLFASFSLYFDKPFRVGDFIVIGSDSGTVEKIGVKSTRLRTLQGEELVMSNAELTTARVQNFKKMEERRIVFNFGITYETPQDKVEQIKGMVEKIFEGLEGARLDRVHFTAFGDSALTYEVVYHVVSSDYVAYLDLQEQINLALLQRFTDAGIEFAYPTQTLYLKK